MVGALGGVKAGGGGNGRKGTGGKNPTQNQQNPPVFEKPRCGQGSAGLAAGSAGAAWVPSPSFD